MSDAPGTKTRTWVKSSGWGMGWKVWKFRMRMVLGALNAAPHAPPRASVDELDALVAVQTNPWAKRAPWSRAAIQTALHELNDRSCSVFIFSVRGKSVRVWRKREFSFPAEEEATRREQQRSYRSRAMFYQAFIETVLRRSRASDAFDFALDVNDLPEDSPEFPIFGFQKERSALNLLLPDVDFFNSKWYCKDHDALSYTEKKNSACFVGSSTGGWLTTESIGAHEIPRLKAAAYFHGHPHVNFQIANATQCLSEEARAHLMAQPYFAAYTPWADQLRHRFVIVMDGNGASCSRLVKGLLSHSVVVKFSSPHALYYFPALQPGRDYLLVEQEADVERIIEREALTPGSFEGVALAGRQFAEKYLTMGSVMDYTARLLKAYAELDRR